MRAATVCGIDFFTPDHVVFASDCPFDKEKGPGYIRDTVKVLNSLGLSQADMKKICFRNAQKLFGLSWAIISLIFGTQALGVLYASPPDIPASRKEALRAALLAATRDPQFVADAKKTQIDISLMTGQEVEAFIARASAASPAVVERAKKAFAP